MKNKIILLFWLIASSGLLSVDLLADEGQFYFTAKSAPMGASSEMGKGNNAVYLRWDLVEGTLPDDIVRFELRRDGAILMSSKKTNEFMSENEIHKMYSGEAEQQRLLQTINFLKKISLAEKQNFDASNFPAELINRFNTEKDSAWVFLASRQNFNIARARYRAFLDTTATGAGIVTYTLNAINATGDTAQIGKVTVDTSKNTYQLLPVTGFEQLKKTQCDITEIMADHNTVFLYWQPTGNDLITGKTNNLTNKTASALQTAGYQIYRNTSNLAPSVINASPRNIAEEASQAGHDQRGNIKLDGLERVNELLVIAEGSIADNKKQAAYIDTPQQLIAAGLKPGDKRAYYIVAVDFAGHLGETVGTIVQVPDRQMPATPWNLRFTQAHGNAPRASIEWDASTLANYTAHFSFSRVICNAAEAAISNKIEYAANLEACDKPISARIDIAEYLVYRFDTADEANGFADSDGDGYANIDEKAMRRDPCDINSKPPAQAPFITRRIRSDDSTVVINLPGNRSAVRFIDPFLTQPENVGETFWYRVASITADGNVSPLSATMPVVFWDNVLPAKPVITAVQDGNCCNLKPVKGVEVWDFNDEVNQFDNISLVFNNNPSSQTRPVNLKYFSNPESDTCQLKDSQIAAFWGTKPNRELIYPGLQPGSHDSAYCRVAIPDDMDLCKTGAWQLTQKSCQQTVNDGDILDESFTVTIFADEPGACVFFMKEIAGQYTLAYSNCGTNTLGPLVFELEPGECGFGQQQDASGNQSPIAEIPCTTAASSSPPGPPQIISFTAGESSSIFSWRLPLEPVAITLIEISSDVDDNLADDSDKQLISVANAGFNPGKLFDDSSSIHALLGDRDQWCIRMKSVAPSTQDVEQVLSSQWSSRLCNTRRSGTSIATEYMPWPKLATVSIQKGLPVFSVKDFVTTEQGMAYEKMSFVMPFSIAVDEQTDCVFHDRTENYGVPDAANRGLLMFARDVTCPSLASSEKLQIMKFLDLPFMVYRQGRTPQGDMGSWVQVSPLINKIYWEQRLMKGTGAIAWLLNDPYFKFSRLINYSDNSRWMLSFVDRYPHIAEYEYRYQIVSFSESHAIKKIYLSATNGRNWVSAAQLTGVGESQ